jgi:hypothetical protein
LQSRPGAQAVDERQPGSVLEIDQDDALRTPISGLLEQAGSSTREATDRLLLEAAREERSELVLDGAHRKVAQVFEIPGHARGGRGERLSLDHAAALELEHPAHRLEYEWVGLSLVCFEHAHEVTRAGDPRAQATSERLAIGAVAEVVVAARAEGLGDDLDLAGVAFERDHALHGAAPMA